MPSKKLSERGKKAATARWGAKAKTREGHLVIKGVDKISCYVLEDERRVIAFGDFLHALNMKKGGYKTGDNRAARFASGKLVAPFSSQSLVTTLRNPIKIVTLGGHRAHAYPAETLSDLCWVAFNALKDGVLQPQQVHIGERAQILLKAFSRIGIIGLIDEATGYQYARDKNALAEILGDLISEEAGKWVKRFPDEYYSELYRLYKIEPTNSKNKPWRFGRITKDIIYSRLAPGVVEALNVVNPISNGSRKNKNHQHLTPPAVEELNRHVGRIIGYMNTSENEEEFMCILNKKLPVQEVKDAKHGS